MLTPPDPVARRLDLYARARGVTVSYQLDPEAIVVDVPIGDVHVGIHSTSRVRVTQRVLARIELGHHTAQDLADSLIRLLDEGVQVARSRPDLVRDPR